MTKSVVPVIPTQEIQAYFSHSYRAEDREVNLFFWKLFSKQNFFFTVDPRSENIIITHLERMMRYCDCFIAIVTRRRTDIQEIGGITLPQPQTVWTHSQFIAFENYLAELSDKPRLVFVESGLDASLFGEKNNVHIFDRTILEKREKDFRSIINDFSDEVRSYIGYSSQIIHPTGKAGILLNIHEYQARAISDISEVLEKVGGYSTKIIDPNISNTQNFIRQISDIELIVTEVRPPYITPEALAFIQAKALPCIRIAKIDANENLDENDFSPSFTHLYNKYVFEDTRPVISWRKSDHLIHEIIKYLLKFQQPRTLLDSFEEGRKYFLSAGRKSAKIFISNSHSLNGLALDLVKSFQTVNIEFFQYRSSIQIGMAWKAELERELTECDVFVALINGDYHNSEWCQYELQAAYKRWEKGEVVIFPYLVEQTRLPDLIKEQIQCAFMAGRKQDEIVQEIVQTIDGYLTGKELTPENKEKLIDDFGVALEKLWAMDDSNKFINNSLKIIRQFADRLGAKALGSTSSVTQDGVAGEEIDLAHLFSDLPNFPHQIPFLIAKSNPEQKQINNLLEVLKNKQRSIYIVISPNYDRARDNQINQIRQSLAQDIIIFQRFDLPNILQSPNSSHILKREILKQVNILNYAPFKKSGVTPSDVFFGRDKEIHRIQENISTTSFSVIGGRRMGKSSLLSQLHKSILSKNGFYSILHDTSVTPTVEEFFNAKIDDNKWEPQKPINAPTTFEQLLQSSSLNGKFVLLLDEIDALIASDQNCNWKLFKLLRSLSNNQNLQIIIGGERTLRESIKNYNSPLFNFTNELLLGPLNYATTAELVTQPMKRLCIEFTDQEAVVNKIYEYTSGHPNVVQRMCVRLIEILIKKREQRKSENYIEENFGVCLRPEDVEIVASSRKFQDEDFLATYFERATPLEQIIVLLMGLNPKVYSLQDIMTLLRNKLDPIPKPEVVQSALDRLVNLRSILRQEKLGYEFAVEAFPKIIANLSVDDLLLTETSKYSSNSLDG